MSLSLVSGKLAFLHNGYIAAIENYCVPTAIIPYAHSVIAVRRLVQHDNYYVCNVIVIRRLIQLTVIATELYT